MRVDRVDIIALCCDDQRSQRRPGGLPIERLSIEVASKVRPKAGVEVHRASALPAQRGDREAAATAGIVMVIENRLRVA